QHERARLERDLVATARAMVQAVDSDLATVRTAAEVLSTSAHLRSGDFAAFYEQAKTVADRQIGSNVVLSDASGQQVLNTLRPLGEQLPRHGNPDQLRAVFASKQPVISNVYVGGLLNKPVMSIDVPVL